MRPPGLRILLVGTGRAWSRAVWAAAETLRGAALDAVATGGEAIGRIVTADRPYSHVLVQPSASDGLIEQLHGLTSGEPGSGTALTLLGGVGRRTTGIPRVMRPDRRSVVAALRRRRQSTGAGGSTAFGLALPDALARSMIEVRYQPIVRVSDGACVGVEGLARLNHPVFGTFPPVRFLPWFEDRGLGRDFTRAVTERAFRDFAGPALCGRSVTLALNVPLDVLLDAAAMTAIDASREAVGLPRERVVFELTERQPVDDLPALRRAVERLRAVGYGVALDDLGPSIAQHAALMTLPFSTVKLDIEVVRGRRAAAGAAFLREAVGAARARGAMVIAEGVENAATWRGIAALGVDHVQGFLASRPLPAGALPVWLDTWPERRGQLPGLLRGTPDQTSR